MAPMGIRLSPLGVVVFCLLGVGVIYHLYAGVISSRIAALRQHRTVDLRELLALSVEAALQGGREVRRVREENVFEKSKGKAKDGANERLTMANLCSHKKMYHLIKNTFPYLQVNAEQHPRVGAEETGAWSRVIPADLQPIGEGRAVAADDITVWIDPLDAAHEYSENLQKYVTTMVCVAVNGIPIIGVIHKPFTDYTAWALVGSGANVRARSSYSARSPRVIVSRSHEGRATRFIQTALGNHTQVHSAGGAGYKVLALLDPPVEQQERADVYLHITYIQKRDVCAGNAILRALGGHMTSLKGEQIDYSHSAGAANHGGVLASVGLDHLALLAKLQSADSRRER
ncbi:inositol monophosphatase 3-like [Conger conger]|uniref:inositol monophosphatase 3-like n=1 Tax=Conger conger TaxID=82655 RepID=UPI002A59AB88|nr:inositol monophosphatase 3-like [Conger conger]